MELLIATAVISTGLFAAASIVFSNLQLSDRDADEIVAVNLAREGIEEAKQLRDSNWLAGNPFDAGFVGGASDYTATPIWDGKATSPGVSFDFAAASFADSSTQVRQSANPATPGFYTQNDPGATLTLWNRLLTFHPICDTGGGLTYKNDGQTCGPDPKVGIRVEANIQWRRKGQAFNRVMYEDLFDWR